MAEIDEMRKTSFDDMHNIAISQVFDKLDVISRFRVKRVSRRMNKIQSQVKNNLESVKVEISRDSTGQVTVTQSGFGNVFIQSKDEVALSNCLLQLASNTHVHKIESHMDRWRDCAVNAILSFDAEELDFSATIILAPTVGLPVLPSLAQMYRKLSMGFISRKITVQDLCAVREMMLGGKCKLESFSIRVFCDVHDGFLRDFFGVTLESGPAVQPFVIYRARDETVEIYIDPECCNLKHYEGNLQTTLDADWPFGTIIFERCNGGVQPDENYEKVQFNVRYA